MKTSIVPISRCPISIRVATMADLPFMDGLQKKHNKALGYFPTKQFEGYIEMGAVLIAEDRHEGTEARRHEGEEGSSESPCISLRASVPSCLRASPLGYIIARDRYLKRDELGVIYQLCVAPGDQRKLIGASLVKAVFQRSAYGCRLYCCWCAQDLAANYFWESLGFVPIAFRAGSTGKKRVHIFWQRRIDSDQSAIQNPQSKITPYWYPFQTNSGAIREDRIVFPIPPGVHWSEVKAVQLPVAGGQLPVVEKAKRLPGPSRNPKSEPRHPSGPPPGKVGILVGGKIKYVDRPGYVPPVPQKKPRTPKAKAAAENGCPERSRRIDPKYLSAARELRDRYLEHVNGERVNEHPLLPSSMHAKYEVGRARSDEREATAPRSPRALPAAA